jgi:hypothetical protein
MPPDVIARSYTSLPSKVLHQARPTNLSLLFFVFSFLLFAFRVSFLFFVSCFLFFAFRIFFIRTSFRTS